MLSFSSAELNAWIAAYFYPLTRTLALLGAVPLFSNAAMPLRIRLMLGLAITIALAPALPAMPPIEPGSSRGLLIIAQQLVIGVAMGFAMRLATSAIDFAGEVIGLQMGLGFATFYDPTNASQTPVISEFISLLGLLILLSTNGHLMIIATLTQSFSVLPVGGPLPGNGSWSNLTYAAGFIFASGLMLALPVVSALLITNTALGVLTRAAPQLNIFAVGFPLTLAGGFIMLILSLNFLATPILQVYEHGLQSMLGFFVKAG